MRKFVDDVRFVPADEIGPPRTPAQLLSDLGVRGKSKQAQRAAVAEWLEGHEPGRGMQFGLELYGLIDSPPLSAT